MTDGAEAVSGGYSGRAPAGGAPVPRAAIFALVLFATEVAVFGMLGRSFISWASAGEILSLGVELAILALALRPIVIAGGIDLSAGALVGMLAALWGATAARMGASWPSSFGGAWAAGGALVLGAGALAGGLNALLVAGLRLAPPLATLGTYALFRGLGQVLIGPRQGYSPLPASPEWLSDPFFDVLPVTLMVFAFASLGALRLERSEVGRRLWAQGPAAGARALAWAYASVGLAAGLATALSVARLGMTEARAGVSVELPALAAVVLGGSSFSGRSGSVGSTLLAALALATLLEGARLAALPAEMAQAAAGALLVAGLLADRIATRRGGVRK